jgi:hypothetical protein
MGTGGSPNGALIFSGVPVGITAESPGCAGRLSAFVGLYGIAKAIKATKNKENTRSRILPEEVIATPSQNQKF